MVKKRAKRDMPGNKPAFSKTGSNLWCGKFYVMFINRTGEVTEIINPFKVYRLLQFQ